MVNNTATYLRSRQPTIIGGVGGACKAAHPMSLRCSFRHVGELARESTNVNLAVVCNRPEISDDSVWVVSTPFPKRLTVY